MYLCYGIIKHQRLVWVSWVACAGLRLQGCKIAVQTYGLGLDPRLWDPMRREDQMTRASRGCVLCVFYSSVDIPWDTLSSLLFILLLGSTLHPKAFYSL